MRALHSWTALLSLAHAHAAPLAFLLGLGLAPAIEWLTRHLMALVSTLAWRYEQRRRRRLVRGGRR